MPEADVSEITSVLPNSINSFGILLMLTMLVPTRPSTSPRTMEPVPSVTISGIILKRWMMKPLNAPSSRPISVAATNGMNTPS
ncbi:hypothetical protein D9M72_615310 [compost metagenome]